MKRFFCLIALSLCFLSSYLLSQSTSATISGAVMDSMGNFIAGADIAIFNQATGVQYLSRTNAEGIYTVSILPPGQYRIQVSRIGFKTIIKPGIILNVQSALQLNFALPIGATSESITVEGGASMINTTDASVSTVVDRKFVENMPLNGRSFQDLISMTPGVVTQSPQTSQAIGVSGDFSVNGQRTESNYYTVDGVTANIGSGSGVGHGGEPGQSGSLGASTALGTTQSLLSIDAMQEFRVESSTYSAEYGRSPGGQFSLQTRSGTNRYRGSLFDYLRNNFFDANDWFSDRYGKPIPALRQNDFGGTVGGPIFVPGLYSGRNRSFFFGSFEGLRLTSPQATTIQYVPNNHLRQAAPSALQPILNAFPLQSSGALDYGNLAQFIESYSLPSNINSTSIRVDHVVSPRTSAFFRFGDTPSFTRSRALSTVTEQRIGTQTYTIGVTQQVSNAVANEFRLGYSKGDSSSTTTLDGFGGAVPIDLSSAMGAGGSPNAEPYFFLFIPGVGSSQLYTAASESKGRQWNLVDTVSLHAAQHNIKVGVDYRRISSSNRPTAPGVEGLFETTQSVLQNAATVGIIQSDLNWTAIFDETALFAQDEWRVNQKLHLSFGLRWEINPALRGDLPYTVLGNVFDPASLIVAPLGTSLWKTTWFNLAPRLGGAWIVRSQPGKETVVRAGGGVFFDSANTPATRGYQGLGYAATKSLANLSFPITSQQLLVPISVAPPYTSTPIYAFPHHLQLPYTLGWNVSIEQALGKEQALTASYVGGAGRRLLQYQELYLFSKNPNFGYVYFFPDGVTSNYQALELRFQRSVSPGVHALVSYTWSHSIDYGSNNFALPLSRGNSDFDVRNNFQAGLSWDIPSFQRHSLLGFVGAGWGLDGRVISRDAFPVTLQGNLLTDFASGSQYYSGVNYDASKPIFLYGAQYPGHRMINGGPAALSPAFTAPSATTVGDAPRNFVRGFGETQVNLAAHKQFRIYDRFDLVFRAESFNLLNHPNFGYVDPALTDATFGQATKMLNQSLGTVSPLYQQGGPRSMQFALKLLF